MRCGASWEPWVSETDSLLDPYEILERVLKLMFLSDERYLDDLADGIVKTRGRGGWLG